MPYMYALNVCLICISVAKVDGVVITESNDILEAIEAAYPELSPMLPKPNDPQFPRVRPLLQLERSLFSSWCYFFSFCFCFCFFFFL